MINSAVSLISLSNKIENFFVNFKSISSCHNWLVKISSSKRKIKTKAKIFFLQNPFMISKMSSEINTMIIVKTLWIIEIIPILHGKGEIILINICFVLKNIINN